MAEWTRAELEQLVPFDVATRQIGDEVVSMTREEYDRWIDKHVGSEKPTGETP